MSEKQLQGAWNSEGCWGFFPSALAEFGAIFTFLKRSFEPNMENLILQISNVHSLKFGG